MSQKKMVAMVSAIAMGAGTLSGCASDGTINESLLGAGLGALAGGAVCAISGANDLECAALVLAGAGAGYLIGERLKPEDVETRNATVGTVLLSEEVTEEAVTYEVAETGSVGSVMLLDVQTNDAGQQCKVIEEVYDTVEDEPFEEVYTMCYNEEIGDWEVV